MCGIAAIIGVNSENKSGIKKMTDAVEHRGPDGEGFFYSEHLCLGHRRLSIIDLSTAGHQPMQKYNLHITYNGEVYNYIELRNELTQLGYTFTSNSDTEVILASYKQWGQKALDKFNGMFAFVIYDVSTNKIFVARDRFGVKPLYYWSSDECIYIASEIKQFTVIDSWQAQLNWQMAHDFLNYSLLDHTEQTLFKNVFQLKPGHYFELDLKDKNISPRPWYHFKQIIPNTSANPEQVFLNTLKDSVKLRLRSDVNVGSCLSGGLDSSSLVCLINENLKSNHSHEKQKTFSACSDVPQFDEKKFIDSVVNKTKVKAHYTYPNPDELFKVLKKLTWHQDEPFSSSSIFAQWCVFKLAHDNNVKVMLDGQGADEQLAGYHSFFPVYWVCLLKKIKWLKLATELKFAKAKHGYSYLKMFKMMGGVLAPTWITQLLHKLEGRRAHTYFHFPTCIDKRNPHRLLNPRTSLRDNSAALITTTNLPMLLHWEDRNSMAHSVEARVPFLDYRLVEFNLDLDDEQKIKNATTKVVLREALKNQLPENIKNRQDKLGFVTAESVWAKLKTPVQFRETLQHAVKVSEGIIDPTIIEYFNQMVSGQKAYDHIIWRAISFGTWLKTFNVSIELPHEP